MNNLTEGQEHANLLRRRAEDALRGKLVEVSDLRPEDFQAVLHELQVHQAELSIQNEELRRVQLELETACERYADLYNFAPAGYCTLNRKDIIQEANQTLALILGVQLDALIHQPLSKFVERDSQDAYYLHRQAAFEGPQSQVSVLCMLRPSGEKLTVRLESMRVHHGDNRLRVMLSDITKQVRNEKEAQVAAALQELRLRVTDQREHERQQLARNLHDGPVQGLIALSYTIHALFEDFPDPELAPHLASIQVDLKEQINELRSYALELRPPMLARFGLEKTIRSHAEIFQGKHPALRISLDLPTSAIPLTEMTSLAMFRIYQEALNNIMRHVHTPNPEINVRMTRFEQQVRLEIQDNGQGFAIPEEWFDLVREGHLGLVGMRERAEAVGGKLEIHSKPGQGTRIVVSVPLVGN